MSNFAESLNDLIIDKRMSLRKLAIESNISAIQYSKYLRGTCPTLDIAVKLANYFECSVDYLFGLIDDKKCKVSLNYDLSKFVPRYIELLELNKTTHWKFAKKYNLSESCLRHWKYGNKPKIQSLIIIAVNLSTSIEYLIGRTDVS